MNWGVIASLEARMFNKMRSHEELYMERFWSLLFAL
jgi:hypothetical protein